MLLPLDTMLGTGGNSCGVSASTAAHACRLLRMPGEKRRITFERLPLCRWDLVLGTVLGQMHGGSWGPVVLALRLSPCCG
ncbi:hypothetical protein NDU88_000623 [Pleurodeles waltl]|uniref:Uncharacterized protein n=1 Tax=Pleurodeles waltl TaxID=8319 RepID=A0AAV7R4P4_PLEWA|nr:hypothetical protein NDU88_000623 [Pleurodeles waltl]